MTAQKVVPVVISVVVIVLVAVIQERSRAAAAILSVMPLAIPLAAWIVFSATGGDHEQTAEFVKSMLVGLLATMAFVAACWFALRARRFRSRSRSALRRGPPSSASSHSSRGCVEPRAVASRP